MMVDENKGAGRLAWSLAIAILVGAGFAFVFGLRYVIQSGDSSGLLSHHALTPFIAVVFAVVGALIAARQPKNSIGWIFLAVGLFSALQGISGVFYDYAALNGWSGFFVDLADWFEVWIWMPVVFMPPMFVFLLFPDGQLPSPRWRPILWASASGLVLSIVVMGFHPGPLESWAIGPGNPFGIPPAAGALEIAGFVAQFLVAVGFFGAIAAFISRFRRSQGSEREQMKWLLYAMALVVFAVLASTLLWLAFPEETLIVSIGFALQGLTVLGIALAAGIAILRYRLYDIDLVINRTLVYGALTVCIVAIYVFIVGGLGTIFQAQGNTVIALVATGLVAVLFQPLRERLQDGVNRLFYGRRDDPLEALSQLGRRLETTPDPDILLTTLVETIAQTLKLPYVAIALRTGEGFDIAAQSGEQVAVVSRLPLVYQGETVGQLIAGQRTAGESFSQSDERLLENIAHQAGPAVHAVQLTAALQHSRLQLVTAREEERRRLRRDLHDSLGATLAALHLEVGALKRSIRRDPDEAEALADELRTDIRATIEDIRHLVYELRPPTLDQLGLVAAVRSQAAQCTRPDEKSPDDRVSAPLQVEVDAPEELPPLPAAVEVAAYRITQEALTNVVHHAQARHCLVRLQLADELVVEIVDDGVGLANNGRKNGGVGLLSMRERALELGGTCLIEPVPGGGTRVLASLPIPEATIE